MKIKITESKTKGTAEAVENGVIAGEMTYSIASDEYIIVDHTEVNPEFKGQGVGKKLLAEIVDMARTKNIKILPLCPFVKAMFERNDDIQDVLKK